MGHCTLSYGQYLLHRKVEYLYRLSPFATLGVFRKQSAGLGKASLSHGAGGHGVAFGECANHGIVIGWRLLFA